MPQNACIWDIGANIGIYRLLASLDPTVRVLGCEPASRNFAVLGGPISDCGDVTKSISLIGLSGMVRQSGKLHIINDALP